MKTILIVEDEIVLQDVYRMILQAHGFNVLTAQNGLVGLSKMKEDKPDVVLLDISMPVMDGREFMRNIDMNVYPECKIIINTNHSDHDLEREMIELGAHKFLLKSSMTPQSLADAVKDIFRT
jgi:DNA-binding NarL/FixJ family response regulator